MIVTCAAYHVWFNKQIFDICFYFEIILFWMYFVYRQSVIKEWNLRNTVAAARMMRKSWSFPTNPVKFRWTDVALVFISCVICIKVVIHQIINWFCFEMFPLVNLCKIWNNLLLERWSRWSRSDEDLRIGYRERKGCTGRVRTISRHQQGEVFSIIVLWHYINQLRRFSKFCLICSEAVFIL